MYYGDNPSDALGRFARQVERTGALSLGAGVGVERRGDRAAPKFAVVAGGGEAKVHPGPLAAVTDAFTRAGVTQTEGTPGGTLKIEDATIAARLYEIENELRVARERLERTPSNASYFNQWEQRSREEAERTIERCTRERARLLRQNRAKPNVQEAEAGKPGTNWTQVSPAARKRINPIVRHYGKMAHPFTACVRDNTERFGPERAKRVCAVVKDMARYGTGWRKGGDTKDSEAVYREAYALADEALASLQRAEHCVGRRGVRKLVVEALQARGEDGKVSEAEEHALGEHLLADLVVLETIARPRDAEVVWRAVLHDHEISEALSEAYREAEHPRDAEGRWREKIGSMTAGSKRAITRTGETVEKLAGGNIVVRTRQGEDDINVGPNTEQAARVVAARERRAGKRGEQRAASQAARQVNRNPYAPEQRRGSRGGDEANLATARRQREQTTPRAGDKVVTVDPASRRPGMLTYTFVRFEGDQAVLKMPDSPSMGGGAEQRVPRSWVRRK